MKKLFFIFLLLTTLAHADQLIIEPDMGRTPIIQAIQSTKHSLKLVMYGFTDQSLLDTILKQKQRGRTINIILEKSPYKTPNENLSTIDTLQKNNIKYLGEIPPFRLIHQKTLIIDDNQAIVMTFNFTNSTFKKTRNFGIILSDPNDIKEIANYFSADWNQQPIVTHSPHLIWSPDDSREKIISFIRHAKQSIHIYAQSLDDYKTIGELVKAARKGIEINILTSNKPRDKVTTYLTNAGIHIRRDKHLYIHAKAMVIDNQQAIIGSTNLTRASLDDNRELSVVTDDMKVIKPLNAVFQRDWDASE